MYKEIYEYLCKIDLEKREIADGKMQKFIKDYNDYEFCGNNYNKNVREQLEMLTKEFKQMEELEEMRNFLWNKIYNNKESDK